MDQIADLSGGNVQVSPAHRYNGRATGL
jgi:hypothetical protein